MKFELREALLLLSSTTSAPISHLAPSVSSLACPAPRYLSANSPTLYRSLINVIFSDRTSLIFVVMVELLSHVWLFENPWTSAHQASPVGHHLLELVQTHVHWVSDAIQPSHPLSSPSPPAFNLSQHHGFFCFFAWVVGGGVGGG